MWVSTCQSIIVITCLIIASHKLGDNVSQAVARELSRPPGLLNNPFKVCLLFYLFTVSQCFHLLSDCSGYCSMMLRYFHFFALFLIQLIMLPHMIMTGRVAICEKCLCLAVFLYQFLIVSNTRFWWDISVSLLSVTAYSLADITPLPCQCLYLTVRHELYSHSITEHKQQILCHIFLANNSVRNCQTVTVFKSNILSLWSIQPQALGN